MAPKKPECGPVEAAVLADLEQIEIPPGRSGLAAAALTLARKLDTDAGLATAAVARELRATLAALLEEREDEGADAFDQWISRLSTPVRDS